MIQLTKVIKVESAGGFRLRVLFSNGREGVHDFSALVAKSGVMVEPLKDEEFFRRVFIEFGVLTWPNGFDFDSIALHDEMAAAGELREHTPA